MADDAAEIPDWSVYVAALEAVDASVVSSLMPTVATEQLVAEFPELASVEFRDHIIDTPAGPVPVRSYRRSAAADGTGFVWVHGGAFIGGHLDMAEAHWVALAVAARGVPVLSVDYRKCLHGVRHPAPSDDVLAAWLWAIEHADDLGMAPDRTHLGGASAGANLAAAVAKRLRDGAGTMPSSLVLLYPTVHAELPRISDELQALMERVAVHATSPQIVRQMNLQFVGDEAAFGDPYAFAANGDVSGLPPVYILNSEADPLRASGEAFGDRLRESGVDVRVELEPGTEHGHVNEACAPPGRASIDRIGDWLTGGR